MGAKERQQMCLECNGRIPFDSVACPYCGVQLNHLDEEFTMTKPTNAQDSNSSLYPPPYKQPMSVTGLEEKKSPLFMKASDPLKDLGSERKLSTPTGSSGLPSIAEESEQTDKGNFWPILLLSLAANLFLIGFLQLCFSEGGKLTLEWDSNYWFVYCLMAVPCFLFGFKKINSMK